MTTVTLTSLWGLPIPQTLAAALMIAAPMILPLVPPITRRHSRKRPTPRHGPSRPATHEATTGDHTAADEAAW